MIYATSATSIKLMDRKPKIKKKKFDLWLVVEVKYGTQARDWKNKYLTRGKLILRWRVEGFKQGLYESGYHTPISLGFSVCHVK